VGAHKGESILLFQKNFISSIFFSFEPLKDNFFKLKKNTFKFKQNIYYFNIALGEKKETRIIKEMAETSSSTLKDIDEGSKYYKRKKFFLGINEKETMFSKKNVEVDKAYNIVKEFNVKKIDLLKIDTEGYEFNVIKGFEKEIKKVKVILFEHHYDLMIRKEYSFSDINKYLVMKGFVLKYKFKMPFRKTFEYIYLKSNKSNA
jgi:FkbM family methyltransferase